MADEEQDRSESSPVDRPYGGLNAPSNEGDLPGEFDDESAAQGGGPQGPAPSSPRAAEEPIRSGAVEAYSGSEPEPGPPDPLTSDR